MNINKAFPSKFLKAADLDGSVSVEVIKVDFEEVGQNKERRPVAYFKGIAKGVVLNKTRSNGIVRAAGSEDTDDWPGTIVELYPSTTQFQGEEVECIGIRPPKGKRSKPAPPKDEAPEAADDIPF